MSLLTCFVVIMGLTHGHAAVFSRSEWEARQPRPGVESMKNTPLTVIMHHSATRGCTDRSSCSALVRSFQRYHMDTHGWLDIGYNFLVGEDGNIYEGRGWDKVGAHARGHNSDSIGICVIGNFEERQPARTAQDAAQRVIDLGVSLGKISPSYTLRGHRDVGSTLCPGQYLYDIIRRWAHYKA
ncbi:Peptidoglycan-recognition protein SC2 [Lamellibrachia satsuma]|nr:Peptidoglycan-recognition protein SC2 [Lamellibrachia satsuma]